MSILESLMSITGEHGPGVDGDAPVRCLPLGKGGCVPAGLGTDARWHRHGTPARLGAVVTGSRAPGAQRDAEGLFAGTYDGPAADALPARLRAPGPVGSVHRQGEGETP